MNDETDTEATKIDKAAVDGETSVSLPDIVVDQGVQIRTKLDLQVVAQYAECMTGGVQFPPITIFRDADGLMLLADGFHRVAAATEAGLTTIRACIQTGDRRDAVLHAVGANATHGLMRSRADKRRAVQVMLADGQWGQWASRKIADLCQVSHTTVDNMRREAASGKNCQTERTVERGGRHFIMDTTNIGRGGEEAGEPSAGASIPKTSLGPGEAGTQQAVEVTAKAESTPVAPPTPAAPGR